MASEAGTSSPSISIRQHLRWLPDPRPGEPTSTLVLSTSRNYFVDTRVLVPQEFDNPSVLPRSPPKLELSHLDWAFAGTSSSTLRTRRLSSNSNKSSSSSSAIKPLTPTGERDKKDVGSSSSGGHTRSASGGKVVKIRECTWTHWVDSRGPVAKHTHADHKAGQSPTLPADWVDTGTIWPTDRENEFLEKGQMLNKKGVLQDMEELWHDFEPQRLPGENKIVSIVLTAENPVLGTKGMVIRLGGWCQGVICSSGGEIGVERWCYGAGGFWDGIVRRYDDSAAQHGPGTWQKIFKLGNMGLPCESACLKSMGLTEGDSLTHGGLKWTVVEHELL